MRTNRWCIAGAAVATHVCLGSVYAWSVFVPALQAATGWSRPQLTWAFSLAIASLGLTAALAAPLMRRLGPKASVAWSGLLFGLGLAGTALALHWRSLGLLYACYGLLGGLGLGMGYVPPVTTLMRWFADRKGFATGLAVGGFGLGALVASYLGEALLHHLPCERVFLVLAIVYGAGLLASSRLLRLPEASAAPDVAQNTERPGSGFGLIWAVFFVNIATGILLIALARPMLEEAAAGTAFPVVSAVAFMGLFNGLGRLGWSSLSDRLGRTRTWMAMFLIQGVAFFLLRGQPSAGAMTAGLWIIASCYGGGFAICPALVADAFGPARAPRLYGLALTAWSAAALVGPPLAARMREVLGSYAAILGLCAGACALGLLLVAGLGRLLSGEPDPEEVAEER